MARIRTIKPEFWTDPDIVAMPMAARLFFIGCWNHADDYGVLKDDPERLRLQIMPADPVDAPAIVDELVERRHLVRMVAQDGTRVLVVRTFDVHQKIDKRATGRWGVPDEFAPAPFPQVSDDVDIPTDPAQSPPLPTTPADTPPIPTDPALGRERKGMEGKGKQSCPNESSKALVVVDDLVPPPAKRHTFDEAFDAFWSLYPNKTRTGRLAARKAWDKARKQTDPELIYASLVEHTQPGSAWSVEPQFIPGAGRWLNEGRYLSPPPTPSTRPLDKPSANRAKIAASVARMTGVQSPESGEKVPPRPADDPSGTSHHLDGSDRSTVLTAKAAR